VSIDAVALLRIRKLAPPQDAFGGEHTVQHRGNASLVNTFNRFDGTAPDEHALALRRVLGSLLDAHDDSRGILFFPDVCEPRAKSYDAIVHEVGGAGVWAPNVALDHVPARYTAAPANSHEALVAQMVEKLGRDAATQLDMMAMVNLLVIEATGGRADAVEDYRATLVELTRGMGSDFARIYEQSLRNKKR
jgi:hypothetical protein